MRKLIILLIILVYALAFTGSNSMGSGNISESHLIAIKITKIKQRNGVKSQNWENIRVAEAIHNCLVKHPKIKRDEFLSLLYQESCFFENEINYKSHDYGIAQINQMHFKAYGVNAKTVMEINKNLEIGADIWLNSGQNYARYCGNKRNVKFYKKKLAEIRSV